MVRTAQGMGQNCSLLLASRGGFFLTLARNNFAKHDNTVAIHECDPRQTLAILEGIANKRLLRSEAALSHLVGLQRVRILHLLASGLLAHLPLQLRDAARGAAA